MGSMALSACFGCADKIDVFVVLPVKQMQPSAAAVEYSSLGARLISLCSSLGRCKIGDEGIMMLAAVLKANTTITSIMYVCLPAAH